MPKQYSEEGPLTDESDSSPLAGFQQIYGAVPDIPSSGRVITMPIAIAALRPDMRQPRRAIPIEARGQWDGSPAEVPTVLGNWHLLAEHRLGAEIPLVEWLFGGAGDRLEKMKSGYPVLDVYLDLIDLAASIKADGLINPIHTAKGVIESGERRWLAYWLLNLYSGEDYSKIPAVEKAKIDVWSQAAENGSRAPLNAIGMARQLALLVMDMYPSTRFQTFDRFEDMILPGECDRRFYAQVANGNMYRIKSGLLERVLSVTGLRSKDQVSQYRALLSLPDDLWRKADDQSWAEATIRDYWETVKAQSLNGEAAGTPLSQETVQTVQRLTVVSLPKESNTPSNSSDTAPATPAPVTSNVPPRPSTVAPLYGGNDAPAQPKGIVIPRQQDPDDWDDEDEEADERIAPEIFESTSPIVDDEAWGDLASLLRYLKASPGAGGDQLRMRAQELMTVSRNDVYHKMSHETMLAEWWQPMLELAGDLLMTRWKVQQKLLDAFMAHLWDVGEEMNERRRGEWE